MKIKFQKIQVWWWNIQCFLYRLFGPSYVFKCGHKAKSKTVLTINGKSGIYQLGKKRDYCPQCWAKAAIKCAWCKEIILPGDPITLYGVPKDENFKIPEHAVVYETESHVGLVGCLQCGYCDSCLDRQGFWVMPGKVQRVLSPIEIILYGSPNDEVRIFNNLGDINYAILVPDKIERPLE